MHDERNKANAQHSTGPVTEEGKAASARNSTKHGIFAQTTTLLPGESQEVYDCFQGQPILAASRLSAGLVRG